MNKYIVALTSVAIVIAHLAGFALAGQPQASITLARLLIALGFCLSLWQVAFWLRVEREQGGAQ